MLFNNELTLLNKDPGISEMIMSSSQQDEQIKKPPAKQAVWAVGFGRDYLKEVQPFHQEDSAPAGAIAPRKVMVLSKKVSPLNLASLKPAPVNIRWLPLLPANGVGSGDA